MSRTLNGEPLPDDCPCPVAVINTSQNVGGHLQTTDHQELRPLTSCPHHGGHPSAADRVWDAP
jgi:hypothetical protein